MDASPYGEYSCKYDGCGAVFMDRDVRRRHYRRVHNDPTASRPQTVPLSREELLHPDG